MELENKYVLVYHLPCIICVMGFNPTPACTDVQMVVDAVYQCRDISFLVCHEVPWESIWILPLRKAGLPVAETGTSGFHVTSEILEVTLRRQ